MVSARARGRCSGIVTRTHIAAVAAAAALSIALAACGSPVHPGVGLHAGRARNAPEPSTPTSPPKSTPPPTGSSTTQPTQGRASPESVAARYVTLSNTVDYRWPNPYHWVDTIQAVTTTAFYAQQQAMANQYLSIAAAGHANPVLEHKWTIQQQQMRSDSAVVQNSFVSQEAGTTATSEVVRVTYQPVTYTAQDPTPTDNGQASTIEVSVVEVAGQWLVSAVTPPSYGS